MTETQTAVLSSDLMAGEQRGKPTLLGERVRALRLKRKWTQEDVARRAGISVNSVANIETGVTTRVSGKTAEGLQQAFGVDADELGIPPRRTAKVRRSATPEQQAVIAEILALPSDDLRVVRDALRELKRLKGRKR